MFKKISFFVAIAIAICISGCGGGESNRGLEVSVQTSGVSPRDITVSTGDRVVWTNNTGYAIKITGGNLVSPSRASTVPISINADGTFTPDRNISNFGDTYKWKNNKTVSVTLEVLDESGNRVQSIPLNAGEEGSYKFTRAGVYTCRLAGANDVIGRFTLLGSPSPDDAFTSASVLPGRTFSTMLFANGSQNYYVMVGSDTTSHITGKITIQ